MDDSNCSADICAVSTVAGADADGDGDSDGDGGSVVEEEVERGVAALIQRQLAIQMQRLCIRVSNAICFVLRYHSCCEVQVHERMNLQRNQQRRQRRRRRRCKAAEKTESSV
jgi:hypothetical protein